MFPPSLPAPPYPTPDLFPVKFQPRRTSAPAVSGRSNTDIDRSCQNKTHHSNNETISSSNIHHENLVNSLSSKYSPQSPPQSIIAESVSYSEFNSLLVANENFSSETSFINKLKNDSISKSNLSQLSEESLLSALVRCQNISEDCVNYTANKKKFNSNTQHTVFNATNSSSCDIQCSVKLPDSEYLNHELITNNDNSNKIISNPSVFNGKCNTLDKKVKNCSNQSLISTNQNVTLFEQSILDKQNISKVELAKRCWENYFRPKPPRIARKKTINDESINQSISRGSIHNKSYRSNSVDCTLCNYDNKIKLEDNTIQQKCNDSIQTSLNSFISSNNDNTLTIDSQSFLKDDINQSNDCITSKYTRKGYSPSFIRLIVANELDNFKQLKTMNIEQLNCQHSTSTLTLTDMTTSIQEYKNAMNSIHSNELNENCLYQSNIEFTNYDKDNYSNDWINDIRPQSVTLQRHCIQLINQNNKLHCTSLDTNKIYLSNQNNLNKKSNTNDIIHTYKKKYSYPIIDNITQTDIHLNKSTDWSRLHVDKNRLIRNINKKYKRYNTLIDHFVLPLEKYINCIRSNSVDDNSLKSYTKYNSLSIGIDRSESFYYNVKHISSSDKLKKTNQLSCNLIDYPENNLPYVTSSSSSSLSSSTAAAASLYSPISTSSLICTSVKSTSIIPNDSLHLLKKRRQFSPVESYCKIDTISFKDKTTNNSKTFCEVHSVDSVKNCDVNASDDKDLINFVYSEYDHEDDKFNDKLRKMSLSPAARRYEEHVLATASGRPYNKLGNQLHFIDHKNYAIQQNSIKNVKILPEYHYNNKPNEVIKDSNYDDEEEEKSDSVYHQNEEQLNAELWREKLGAITRWKREVDDAMLAGETDFKEIFYSPENELRNRFIEKDFNLTHIPNQHDTVHYLQSTNSHVNSSLNGFEVNYPTTYGLSLEQSKNHIKPIVQDKKLTLSANHRISHQSNNLKPNANQMNSQIRKNVTLYDNSMQKNYQSTSQTVPSKVVINPSGVLNDHIYHYDNDSQLEKPQQIASQYQPMWIKASKPQVSFSHRQQQQPNSSNHSVVQTIQQIQNSLNSPYYSSNIPTSINSFESNHLNSNMNSSKNRHKSSTTVKSFRNFFTPKLRRKTYELDNTEYGEFKQDYYLQANKLLNNSGGQYTGNNLKSPTGINNQFRKVVPSASYTEALNLAVAANTALYEAFHQQSIDSCNKMNSAYHNTPVSFKQQKLKSSTSTVNPDTLPVTNEGFSNEISPILRDTVETEHKNKPYQWTKVIKPHKNISLSPISSISQFNGDENSSVEKQNNTDKLKSTTVEQTLYSDNKCRSPKLLIKEKLNDLMDSSAETRRTTRRPRSSFRHAVTLSPYRRKPDMQTSEQCNSPYLDPSPIALSSGFVSAGSIVNAVDEATEKMNRDELTETSSKVRSVPPPVGVHDYPIVTNLEKDLNKIDSLMDDSVNIPTNKSYQQFQLSSNSFTQKQSQQQHHHHQTKFNKLPPLQALPPCKLLLGRVASNEDICIETETPIAFNIAATDKEICITRVASVDDLKYQQNDQFNNNEYNNHLINKKHKRIPISLRLTFGSESKLNKSTLL
ncbi:hypothetical protein MN116_002713 [Schistosoma mekongi]|uniref:Uncharacterized protein n=1 Tax=Schistosoma mekongi TaxID=38744 RepID=A0AAE2D668_SCHME|nr:hypothetical protein MN116_002713 [Schistosoma mekongi]